MQASLTACSLRKEKKGVRISVSRLRIAISFMKVARTHAKQYIEQRGEGYWIVGTRISLDSVVCSFLNGESPEGIAQNLPLLSLEQVYGAIAFYLANRELVDTYLIEGEAEFEKLQQSFREKNPLLYQKLKTAQMQKQSNV